MAWGDDDVLPEAAPCTTERRWHLGIAATSAPNLFVWKNALLKPLLWSESDFKNLLKLHAVLVGTSHSSPSRHPAHLAFSFFGREVKCRKKSILRVFKIIFRNIRIFTLKVLGTFMTFLTDMYTGRYVRMRSICRQTIKVHLYPIYIYNGGSTLI